jgi:ABC-2 type transport system permease protein
VPGLSWFLIVIPLFLLILLSFGVGMILSTITVFFRDMEYLWEVLLMLIMYCCAIFYPVKKLLKSGFGWILKYNPLYGIIYTFRSCIFGDPLNWKYIAYAGAFGLVTLIIGTLLFYKKQDEFILHI